jgi:hypothetical protein
MYAIFFANQRAKNTFDQIKADVIRPSRDANLYNLWTFLQNPKAE